MMLSIQGQDITSTLTFILFSEKNLEYNPNTYVEKYIDKCVIIMLFIYIYICYIYIYMFIYIYICLYIYIYIYTHININIYFIF